MADIDLQATDASHEFDGGAIFERIDPEGAGTGQYEPFLTIQHKDTEAGFNSTENGNLDNVDSNGGLDGRTNDLLLSTVPIKVIDGVAYYEFRVDMNEDNNDPIISVESLELYISDSGAVGADFQGIDEPDAFLLEDGYTKIFDLDADGDDRLVLSDVTSSGSGTDDYRFLVPVSLFGDADPATTYVVLYTEMGLTDTSLDSSATFEEWRTEIAATINGVKFVDLDRDGVFDEDETGLGGVTVFIDDDRDGVFDDGERSTVTDSDGSFTFYGVTSDHEDGAVWVDEVVPDSYEQTTGTHEVVVVDEGGMVSAEIGNAPLVGSISGTKWADTNNDDNGDVGVAAWTINLYEDEDGDGEIDVGVDDLIDTTTTDTDGTYSFANLLVGDYIVEEETRSGWQAISATVAGATVVADTDTVVDFVNEQLGSISGTKWADTNNDDTGDVGVAAWTINLYEDEDGDGEIDVGVDDLIDTTTTDTDGTYSFTDVAPGDYIVEEETQTGWQAISATIFAATVTAGADTGSVDFINEELGSIIGTKWADTDNDDDGDEGVGGWTINLYEDEDGDGVIDVGVDDLLDTTTTDTDGTYSFDGLAPGDYIVEEETQTGWQAVSAAVTGATVTAGDATTVDFVNEELASISGYKFADLDEDGVWDDLDGEDGIEGWSISLYADDGDGVLDGDDAFVLTVQTDADGHYAFTDLAPGDYIVAEATQNGWVQTAPNALDADPESGDINGGGAGLAEFGYVIDLGAGDENDGNDFGNFLLPGSGVRTPGFWGSPNGLLFWDGIEGNETKSGPDFPGGELAPDGYLIIGDDGDGIAETGELKILVEDAQKMINASNKDQQSSGFMLARDAIATWLNHLAGNPIGDPADTDSPAYYLDEAVDWLIKYANNNQSGDNTLTANELKANKVRAKDDPWQIGVSDDGIEAGSAIHNALDQYNNDGSIGLTAFAQDGDNGFSTFEQQYMSIMTLQSGTYFV